MLVLALLFFLGMTFWAPALGPEYADVGMIAFRTTEFMVVTLLALSVAAVMLHKPVERRVLHHA